MTGIDGKSNQELTKIFGFRFFVVSLLLHFYLLIFSTMASPNSSGSISYENLKFQDIIEIVANLHDRLSRITPATNENHQNDNNKKNGSNNDGNQASNTKKDGSKSEISGSNHSSTGNSSKSKNSDQRSHHSEGVNVNPLQHLCHDLIYMKNGFTKLKEFEEKLKKPINDLKSNLEEILSQASSGSIPTEAQIREIRKRYSNLKSKIPSLQKNSSTDFYSTKHMSKNFSKDLPNLHMNGIFERNNIFKEIQEAFNKDLDIASRLCLLCFTVFPENAVVKRRLLINWWIGEGLLDQRATREGKTAEEIADKILQDFVKKRFILSIDKKRRVGNSYKMHPLVRSAVIMLAQEALFFNFNTEGIPTSDFSQCNRACLVEAEEGSTRMELANVQNQNQEQSENSIDGSLKSMNGQDKNRDQLKSLFNVSEQYPDFKLELFPKTKSIKVLYLGRWQGLADIHHHIEVESTEFLKGLKNMQDLRLLSLQGISGIRELPSSVSKLTSLRILDLRACYNLEKLPKEIASLKMLTHLDISECYLLGRMPKELSSLCELQIFKGFVISDIKYGNLCTLDDLERLVKLRKLSININSADFQVEKLSTVFKFKELLELEVAWGGGSSPNKSETKAKDNDEVKSMAPKLDKKFENKKQESRAENSKATNEGGSKRPGRAATMKRGTTGLATLKKLATLRLSDKTLIVGSDNKLQKLDLKCFPDQNLPLWLIPENLKKLQKLYIRGGGLNSLGKVEEEHSTWTQVKVLRLRFLNKLKTNWIELQELFPNLEYLEKFKCPKVTFCPCDGTGVWAKSDQSKLP